MRTFKSTGLQSISFLHRMIDLLYSFFSCFSNFLIGCVHIGTLLIYNLRVKIILGFIKWCKHWVTPSVISRWLAVTSQPDSVEFKTFNSENLLKYGNNHWAEAEPQKLHTHKWLTHLFITICRYWRWLLSSCLWPRQNYFFVWLCCLAQTKDHSFFRFSHVLSVVLSNDLSL